MSQEDNPRLVIGDVLGSSYLPRALNPYEVADKVLAALEDNGFAIIRAAATAGQERDGQK